MAEHPTINWRDLCAELLGALENEGHAHWPGGPDGDPLIEQARAALARFGHQSAPQAAGEVGELVQWLRERGKDIEKCSLPILANYFTQAADLIEQRHPTPVPVSERLPEATDCDAEGRCWWGSPSGYITGATWVLRTVALRKTWDTHWLPYDALPLPASEGEK